MKKFVMATTTALALVWGFPASATEVPEWAVGNWLIFLGSDDGKHPSQKDCAESNRSAKSDNLEMYLTIPKSGDWKAGNPSGEGTDPLEGVVTIKNVQSNRFEFVAASTVYGGEEYEDNGHSSDPKNIKSSVRHTPGSVKRISTDVIYLKSNYAGQSEEAAYFYCRNGK